MDNRNDSDQDVPASDRDLHNHIVNVSGPSHADEPLDRPVEMLPQLSSKSLSPESLATVNLHQPGSRSTHPALASHSITWRQIADPVSIPGSVKASDMECPPGAFVIDDDTVTQEPPKIGKTRNKQKLLKPLAKKKKAGGSAAKAAAKARQSARRGNGFSQVETESLLELLLEFTPLSKDEWEKVARLHELRYPKQLRNADSLRRKFSALCRTAPPTGDPSIPPEVLKAKEIRNAMTERADIGEGEESNEEYIEEMQEETVQFSRAGTPGTLGSNSSVVPITQDGLEGDSVMHQRASSAPTVKPLPRPLVRKQAVKPFDDDNSMISAIKASMLQEQMRRDAECQQRMMDREEEKERRAEERRMREEERKEERERRAEERKRSEQMTQMMMLAILGPRATDMFNKNGSSNEP